MAKAKKQKPQRLAGAEESCISPEQEAIIQWFRTVKFRKNLLGGVDETAMWKKLEELYALYEAAIRAERTRYNVLLETSPSKPDGFATSPSRRGKTGAAQPEASGTGEPGDVNLAPAKVDSFAKGSPIRGAGERSETERFSPDASAAQPEASGTGEPEDANLAPLSGELSPQVTERFDPQKEAHSDAPAGQ